MSHNKRHLRTMPDGSLVISIFSCDDNDPDEVATCRKTQFELGRQYLIDPSGDEAYRTIAGMGSDWRMLVHFIDWIRWGEPLPLDPCHCVDVKDLPTDRSTRNQWALQGRKVVVKNPG